MVQRTNAVRGGRASVSVMKGEVLSSILSGSTIFARRWLPPHVVRGMITRMDGDPTERTTPDLFSTTAVRGASAPTKLPAAEATTETAPPRHVLPKNLPNALKHLSDDELDFLHAATLEEMKRRGRTPPCVETDLQTLRSRFDVRSYPMKTRSAATEKRQHVDIAQAPPLTQGKLNAVRAAFKAGVTPSRIAKRFGISQSNVRKALASDKRKRWNDMTIKAHLAGLERQHKALEQEIAEASAHSSTDDLDITEFKRRKLILKDEIERVRHDRTL
jgi:hypothetical protein